ncbi:MAG TPA: PLDc N-terminal domain-containing protein [Ktedonobacterales bacterium]|nr:PLDc N-terminal domain-containing protein [Ktedonobacterales bacterium]
MFVIGDPAIALPPPLPLGVLFAIVAFALDIVIALYFVQDLMKPERRVAGGDKTIWLVVILVGSVLGWAAYLLVGRES